jgi:hypothetical protein
VKIIRCINGSTDFDGSSIDPLIRLVKPLAMIL